jgi:hypothetical protein
MTAGAANRLTRRWTSRDLPDECGSLSNSFVDRKELLLSANLRWLHHRELIRMQNLHLLTADVSNHSFTQALNFLLAASRRILTHQEQAMRSRFDLIPLIRFLSSK